MSDHHHEEHDEGNAPTSWWRIRNLQLAMAAGVLLAIGVVGGWVGAPSLLVNVALAGALVAGGVTFIPESLAGLRHGELGVGTLMTIGAIGALILGELAEAASLAFLYSIAEGLESYSLTQARRGLRSLLSLVPETATVMRDGTEMKLPVADIAVGDRLVLRPGERLATDGVVRSGNSSVDVSAITGESTRQEVGPGDQLAAGSLNGSGVLEVEGTAVAENNSLARIVHIVEEAQERKGDSQRVADRIARPLVPGIMAVSATTAIVGSLLGDPAVWVERSLVILVAAAPCAFAISVPVTVIAAVGAATRSGILIKGGAAVEALGGTRVVALDKTGTLTANRPQVVQVISADGLPEPSVLSLAAALEARSEHPLAAAILAKAESVPAATDVTAVPGSGLRGIVEGKEVRLGRPGFIAADGMAAALASTQQAGMTTVLVEQSGRTVGLIGVRDELRPEAGETVAQLTQLGLEVHMLSGDNAATARALGSQIGIEDIEAELRPEEKAGIVEKLRARGRVAMVGDGINDAPALATADIGIAMGAMGTDVAIETADMALMGEDLRHLPASFRHGRRAVRIMRQNLILSGAIIATLIPLAAFGVLGLAAVVATHEIAEVVVIGDGLRAGSTRGLAMPEESGNG